MVNDIVVLERICKADNADDRVGHVSHIHHEMLVTIGIHHV